MSISSATTKMQPKAIAAVLAYLGSLGGRHIFLLIHCPVDQGTKVRAATVVAALRFAFTLATKMSMRRATAKMQPKLIAAVLAYLGSLGGCQEHCFY